jgi:predicted tellurium resistance membrane protein TerC
MPTADDNGNDGASVTRIMILGVTFFMVSLCPNAAMTFAVFVSGMAVYSFLWWNEVFHENKKKQ